MNNAIKALRRTDDELRVGNYIVLFGGRDMEGVFSDAVNADGSRGEYFAPDTELDSEYTKSGILYVDWEHGRDDAPGAPKAGDLLGVVDWSTAKADERGVWVERALNRRSQYVQALEALIDAGLVGNSSEAVPEGVQKAEDGKITRWPLRRDTLTVTPMEPRMLTENVVSALKALNIKVVQPEPEAEPEAVPTAATAAKATEKQPRIDVQEDTMSEEKQAVETPAVDLEALIAKAVEAGRQAEREKLAKEPAKNDGLVVVADETDKKAKHKKWTLGEFLQQVANNDREVQPFKSSDSAVEYGFDMTKALGPEVVGSLGDEQLKAISGLSESVPADGGLLVGTDRQASIMSRVYNVGDLLRRVDMLGISANSNGMTFFAEAETSRVTGSRRGGIRAYWAAEAAEKTASHPTFRKMELSLNKVIGLVYATDELLQDASALEGWIMKHLPEELRFLVEDAIIEGTNAGMPLGILNSPALISVAAEAGQAATTIMSENLLNMWSRRYLGARDYVWLIHQDIYPQIASLNLGVGTGGALTFMPPGGLSSAPYATINGRPMLEIEYAQTLGTVGDIMLVALGEYQMIDKGGMQSASSIHVRFVYDETTFRFVYRVDGEPKWNAPLTPFHGTNTVSPFVALATRA